MIESFKKLNESELSKFKRIFIEQCALEVDSINLFFLKIDEDKLNGLITIISHFINKVYKWTFDLFIGRSKMSHKEYFPKFEFLKHKKTIDKILISKGIQTEVKYKGFDYEYQI
jgi:hypothetical protein